VDSLSLLTFQHYRKHHLKDHFMLEYADLEYFLIMIVDCLVRMGKEDRMLVRSARLEQFDVVVAF